MHLAVRHPERCSALVPVDPLGAVGDGGEADMGPIMSRRVSPEATARAQELDERVMAGEGGDEDLLESLRLIWPAYFASPKTAPPMPPMAVSLESHLRTLDSVHDQLSRRTLEQLLPSVGLPTLFVLGEQSPILPSHGEATAALVPGARFQVEQGCGHFVWIERPGAVRRAVDAVHGAGTTGSC